MSTRFRVNAIEIHTDASDSPDIRRFPHPLTVLTGPTGTGKSTVFELLRFALGMRHQTTTVMSRVSSVTVNLTVGNDEVSLSRRFRSPTEGEKTVTVRRGQQTDTYPVESEDGSATIGSKLMEWLEIPTDVTVPHSDKRIRITFEHVWSFLHTSQFEIDRSIARHDSPSNETRRRRVFELLFKLINPKRSRLEDRIKKTEKALKQAKERHGATTDVMRRAQLRSHEKLQHDLAQKARRKRELTRELDQLRAQTAVTDDRVIALRRLLADVRRRHRQAREALEALQLAQDNRRARREQLQNVIYQLAREQDAGHRLADIEFVRCPRCAQHLPEERADAGTCPLCLQPEPDDSDSPRSRAHRRNSDHGNSSLFSDNPTAQIHQLEQQTYELHTLLQQGKQEEELLESHLRELELEAARLSTEIDDLSRSITNPRVDALVLTTQKLAQVTEQLRNDEAEMKLWQEIEELKRAEQEQKETIDSLESRLKSLEEEDWDSVDTTVHKLSERYAALLGDIGAPNVEQAYINTKNYLPYINGKKFDQFSIGGSGMRTIFIVAYWLTLLEFSLEHSNLRFPAFLLLDSPQKSLGPHDRLSRKLYERLAGITDSHGDQVQIIVLDSELPEGFATPPGHERIDYDNPGIRGIPLHHPE